LFHLLLNPACAESPHAAELLAMDRKQILSCVDCSGASEATCTLVTNMGSAKEHTVVSCSHTPAWPLRQKWDSFSRNMQEYTHKHRGTFLPWLLINMGPVPAASSPSGCTGARAPHTGVLKLDSAYSQHRVRAGGVAQAVECLPSKFRALSANLSSDKETKCTPGEEMWLVSNRWPIHFK
jgi:hypothetical protein